ncbi:MFS transporter [Chryseolinea lacunae]|uniref:MFS transporter n=1 Tax=Chryseolinea lacunae TaxID=2801331 RepID=UPI001F20B88B|nr:MFS transporter [Chryseolinea lacunae]
MNSGVAVGYYRWRICALLFFATAINYIDRQVLGILAPQLQAELHWSDSHYGLIVTAFQVAYAIGFLFMGKIMDNYGSRRGYAFAVLVWSIAAVVHAGARTAVGFGVARFALGLGEAGNFPAAVKVVAEWFPIKERSLATGIFLSGSSIGAIVAPLVVPVIAIRYGWEWAFVLTGLSGIVWLVFWLATYRPVNVHPKVSAAELAYIQSDPPEPTHDIPWRQLFKYKQTWAFAWAKFLSDPIFSFYFFFLPKFFNSQFGLTLDKIGVPIMIIYVMSDVGSMVGGWLSSFLIRRGWSVARSRKVTMLLAAFTVTPVYFASQTDDLQVAVALIGLALFAHQAWSANLLTLPSDMFPRHAVGSAVGIGSTVGAIGGMFGATTAGFLLESTHAYGPLFVVAGSAYLLAWIILHLLTPELKVSLADKDIIL